MSDEVSTTPTYEEETRGYAITGMTLAWGTLSFLRNRNIIENDGVREIVEDALNGLEALFPGGDRAIQVSRLLLEGMLRATGRPMQSG